MIGTPSILAAGDYIGFGAGGALQIVSLVLGLAALGAGIYTAVDANKYSDEAHNAAGAPKLLWLIGGPVLGLIGCACCFPLGLIVPILWFAVFKKKVESAPPAGFGGPPQGYGGPPPGGGFGGPPGGPPPGGYGGPPPGAAPPMPGGYNPPPGGTQPPPPGGGYPPSPGGPPPPQSGGGYPPPPGQPQ